MRRSVTDAEPIRTLLKGARTDKIDDRPHKCGAGNFSGELIHFGSPVFPDWDAVVEYLMHNV